MGETIADRLEKGRLPLEQALTVATEIAAALAAAHRQGVIHRDLKPGNVVLTKTGAKLLDFSLVSADLQGSTRNLPDVFARVIAQRADALERLVRRPAVDAREALTALPGVGVWTAAETAQRAFGDADALSVGDYHIPKMIGWTLIGQPVDDAGMIDLLEPLRPHRYRAVRLLEASGLAYEPRRGARLPLQQISKM